MRSLIFLALALILLAACGSQPTEPPTGSQLSQVEVTRLVETEVEVTRLVETEVEVTRLIEVIITATPPPTPIPSPTISVDPTIYISGTNISADDLPSGDSGLVVIVDGPPDRFNNIAVVVRNNTDAPVYSAELSATVRDAAGSVLGTGSGSNLVPIYIPPGGIAFGRVSLEDSPPPDATIEYLVTGRSDPGSIFTRHSLEVVEHNINRSNVVGSLLNSSNSPLDLVNVTVICFDDATIPTLARESYTDQERVDAGAQIPFSVSLSGLEAQCARYLIAARGTETD